MKAAPTAALAMCALICALLPMPAQAGRIAYWNFDETGGTIAANQEATPGLDGVLMGDAHFDTGKFGNALRLDGDGDFLDILNKVIPDGAEAYSISAWFKPENIGTDDQMLFESTLSWAISAGLAFGDNALAYSVKTDGASVTNTSTVTPAQDQWHHMYISYNELTATTMLYLDGNEVVDFNPERETVSGVLSPTDGLHIGTNNSGTALFFEGLIDDVAVWSESLGVEYADQFWNGGSGILAVTVVPEPSTGGILAVGLVFVLGQLRRKRQ